MECVISAVVKDREIVKLNFCVDYTATVNSLLP